MTATACGPYTLGPMLARGGMAEIFAATAGPGAPPGLPSALVVKRLLPRHVGRPDFLRLFQREAEIVRKLDHPGIVRVVDVGQAGESHYIVMERVYGRDLKALMARVSEAGRPLPVGVVAYIGARVAEALDHAHRLTDDEGWPLGVVHRDVCPHNVLLSTAGAVKLGDFGIARAADRAAGVRQGQLSGRVGYLSPEQVQGLDVDARSDLFSLGAVLWEMLTGRRLFKAPSQIETMQLVKEARVRPVRELRPDCPEAVEAVVMGALAREVRDRPETAGALAEALDAARAGASTQGGPEALAALLAEVFPAEEAAGGAPPVRPRADGEDAIATSPGRDALADEEVVTNPRGPSPARDDEDTDEKASWDEAETAVQQALDDVRVDSVRPSDPIPLPPAEEAVEAAAPARSAEPGGRVAPEGGRALPNPAPTGPDRTLPTATPMPVLMAVPVTAAAAARGFDESLLAETAPVAHPVDPPVAPPVAPPVDPPQRPARIKRQRAISRTHDIPEIGEENPDDVFLSLAVRKRSVSGRLGLAAAALTVALGSAVAYFVTLDNEAQRRIFDEAKAAADAEKARLSQVDAPPPRPPPDVRLSVSSDPPGAAVLVDWQPASRATPTTAGIYTGQVHLLRVELDGYTPYEETLAAPAGVVVLERHVVLVPMAAGQPVGGASIASDPAGAEVVVAGKVRGVTPLEVTGLPADRLHAALLQAPGHTPHMAVFSVDAQGSRPVAVRMSPADVDGDARRDLHIESVPSGATVHVDGGRAGLTPLFRRLRLGDRAHVALELAGHRPVETPAAVGPAALSLVLALPEQPPQFGYVTVTSSPSGAKVYIGNEEVGSTPLQKHRLPVGRHTIVLDTPARRGTFDVDVGADELLSRSARWDAAGALVLE